jgi:hypothetical protein
MRTKDKSDEPLTTIRVQCYREKRPKSGTRRKKVSWTRAATTRKSQAHLCLLGRGGLLGGGLGSLWLGRGKRFSDRSVSLDVRATEETRRRDGVRSASKCRLKRVGRVVRDHTRTVFPAMANLAELPTLTIAPHDDRASERGSYA